MLGPDSILGSLRRSVRSLLPPEVLAVLAALIAAGLGHVTYVVAAGAVATSSLPTLLLWALWAATLVVAGTVVTDIPRPNQGSGATFTWLWHLHIAPLVDQAACEQQIHVPSLMRAENQRPVDVLQEPRWPTEWPFTQRDFSRRDNRPDREFYRRPNFITHVDDAAIAALRTYYSKLEAFSRAAAAVLDLACSHISHFPSGTISENVGLGMHEAELARNPQLQSYSALDLNANPKLPYPDGRFDLVTCACSIDYFTYPLALLSEVARVLKPGGSVHLSFSNRCFPTKVVRIWLSTNDAGHVWLVGAMLRFARSLPTHHPPMAPHGHGGAYPPCFDEASIYPPCFDEASIKVRS
jgi:SAM-dependent methyltransferase